MMGFSRCAWPITLMLAAAPSSAIAESFVCYPVQRGDTASRLAKRITGDASNKYQPWFNIVDLSARSVPKSQYDRVRSGWRACILEKTVEGRPRKARQAVTDEAAKPVEPAARPRSANGPRTIPDVFRPSLVALRTTLNVDTTRVWLGAAVVVTTVGFMILAAFVRRRNAARIFMIQFAYLFVREFERPLLQHPAEPAMKTQLRVS